MVNNTMKNFTTTGVCIQSENYMVNINDQIVQIKAMVDKGQYFTINRARQYGKTTTLNILGQKLQSDYYVVSLDFQGIGDASYKTEEKFVKAFCRQLKRKAMKVRMPDYTLNKITGIIERREGLATLDELFDILVEWCDISEKPIVMIIDEVDSATNNQVFLDFLAQLRLMYLEQKKDSSYKAFKSIILAGVTDVKNLKRKLRPEDAHKFNSPWNIAADFNIDMSLSAEGISGMLDDYENDHHVGMNTVRLAQEIHDYTGGYPFLVSRICQIIDIELIGGNIYEPVAAWTSFGISEAVKRILFEKNTLFDSLMGKVYDNAPLKSVLQNILFGGERIPYNPDNIPAMDGEMYGFVKNDSGAIAVANRIFETRLYNYFLSLSEMEDIPISRYGSNNRDQFIENGRLNMEKLLEHYVTAFDDIYESKAEIFSEEEGRRRFLLYIRPIINGTGNYYIETETRNKERMDLVIDYLGERHIVELKIWRGNAYHEKGEIQLANYADHYHLDRAYLLSYSFNKNKKIGLTHKIVQGKTLIEAFV